MKNSIQSNRVDRILKKVLPLLIISIIWQLVSWKIDKTYIIPSPIETLNAVIAILTSLKSLIDIGYTIGRMIISFTLSFIAGSLLSLISYKKKMIEPFISPLLTVIKSVPTMGIILLSLIWFRSEGTVLFVCSLIIVPLIYSNMLYGMRSFDPKLQEMGNQFGFSFKKNLKYIYWPSLKPFVNSAIATGISLNMKVLIAAEVLGQPDRAIGTNLFNSKAIIDTPGIFAWSIIVILISFTVEKNIMSLKSQK